MRDGDGGRPGEQNIAVVRALWAAFRAGGVEQALELVDESIEWQLLAGDGRVLHGKEQLREHFARLASPRLASAGEAVEAIPHSYRAMNGMVLVSGTLRLSGSTGLFERTAYWLYWLRDGKLLRVEGCSSLAEGERVLAAEGE